MATKREFNLPDEDDPEFNGKLINLFQQLFEGSESAIQNFTPIVDPEEGTQIGSMWYDSVSNKMKVQTPDGIKIIKFE